MAILAAFLTMLVSTGVYCQTIYSFETDDCFSTASHWPAWQDIDRFAYAINEQGIWDHENTE